MQLGFAVLADAAASTPDGKFSILGGDLGTVTAPSYPAVHGVLAVIIKLLGTPEQIGTEHVLRIEIRTPDDALLGHHTEAPFVLLVPTNGSTEYSSAGFVMNLIGLLLPQPGMYTVHIIADDEEVGILSFQARLAMRGTSDEVDEVNVDERNDYDGSEAE